MEQSPDIKLVVVDLGNAKAAEVAQEQMARLLSAGYEVYGDPISMTKDRVLYTLLRPEIKPKMRGPTGYPSDKQLGYVSWAFSLDAGEVEEAKLTRKECSDLIQKHKDNHEGRQMTKKFYDRYLAEIRGVKPTKKDGSGEFKVDRVGQEDLYDDDLPF